VKRHEAEIRTQPHTAILTFQSYKATQTSTLHFRYLNLILVCFCRKQHSEASDNYPALAASWQMRFLPVRVICGQSTHPYTPCKPIPEVHKVKIVYCQPILCLSALLFHFHALYFSLKAVPKISCTRNTSARDLCSQHYMPISLMSKKKPSHCGVMKPYHFFLHTELCFKSQYYRTLILQTATETASCQ
jgi:hypothetical protein